MAVAEELTANEKLRDAILQRQVYLSKYESGLKTKFNALLDSTEKSVRDEIERRLATLNGAAFNDATHARLNVIADSIGKLRGEGLDSATTMVTDDMRTLAAHEAEYVDTAIQKVSPVVLDTVLPDSTQLGAIVLSEPMQGRVMADWADKLAADDTSRIMDQIRIGMAEGSTTDQIVRGVFGSGSLNGADGAVEATRANAAAIVQTAVAHTVSEARQAYYDANSDIISKEMWVATLDPATCMECGALDGQEFDVGEGEQPELHWNCRCARVPVIDGEQLGDRPAVAVTADDLEGLTDEERADKIAELVGTVPASMTYAEWMDTQAPEFQDQVLGPARAELFRDGLSLDRFIAPHGGPLTLDELRTINPGMIFVSPNVAEHLDFKEALSNLDTVRQAELMKLNTQIDGVLGIESTQTAVIGAWSDGAENSVAMHIPPGSDWETLRTNASMKGMAADQKQVLLFQDDPAGKQFVASFNLEGSMADVHDMLLKQGLEYHTLEATADGVKVYVYGDPAFAPDILKTVRTAGETFDSQVTITFGKGEFIGDASDRAASQGVFKDIISANLDKTEASAWKQVYAGWTDTEAQAAPGIKGFGEAKAKAQVQAWVENSQIKSVADLYTHAAEYDATLRGIAADVEGETGATYKGAGIKKEARVLEKMAEKKQPAARITDIVRGTFIVDTPEQADAVVQSLAKHYALVDEDWRTTPLGYFDRTVKLRLPNGMIGEIQIAPQELLDAKSGKGGGHAMYKTWREMKDATTREALTLQKDQIELYNAARARLPDEWRFLDSTPEAKKAAETYKNVLALLDPTSDLAIAARSGAEFGRAGLARIEGETDKAFAKRVVDKRPVPATLPEDHAKYFKMDKDTVVMNIDDLVSSKTDVENAQGAENGAKRMAAAANGELERRGPITVTKGSGGKYRVVDGNGTLSSVKRYGWNTMPVHVVSEAKAAEMEKAELRATVVKLAKGSKLWSDALEAIDRAFDLMTPTDLKSLIEHTEREVLLEPRKQQQ